MSPSWGIGQPTDPSSGGVQQCRLLALIFLLLQIFLTSVRPLFHKIISQREIYRTYYLQSNMQPLITDHDYFRSKRLTLVTSSEGQRNVMLIQFCHSWPAQQMRMCTCKSKATDAFAEIHSFQIHIPLYSQYFG